MPNQFCRYLSNGYSFNITKNNSVVVGPCCLYKNKLQFDSNLLPTRKLEFESITDWTDSCVACQTLESAGQQSLRQTGPDWVGDHEQSQDPVALDIHLDNDCNAACVTCNKYSSSLWAKEESKLYNNIIVKSENSVDTFIDQIVNTVSLSKLKYVKFFGGEPLFTDTHLKFIKYIPHPEQVTLHYTTNGSIYPKDEVLNEWKKFKTIIFAASLDGIEDQFDYVRWPLPWAKVSQNLIRLRENKDIWNMMFRVEFTANLLNTYYFDRLEDWIKNNLATNLGGDKTEINIHKCWEIWELEKMPSGIRSAVLNKYPADHIIHRLVANLPEPTSLSDWQQFVDTWDVRRNNSWKTAFPELSQIN
jgi:sulfatase maturation enzyme AslB (radical SAM superfamily)